MMTVRFDKVIVLCLLFMLAGCINVDASKKVAAFSEVIPLNEMNTKIRFWNPEKMGDRFRIGDSVYLTLENFSDEKIVFPSDYGIKIYVFDKDKGVWEEIVNEAIYIPPGSRQLSPKGSIVQGSVMPGIIGFGLNPRLSNEGKPVEIRVVVIGNVPEEDTLTQEQVGAYVDIVLQP